MRPQTPDGLDRIPTEFAAGRFHGWLAGRLAVGAGSAARRASAILCWSAALATPPLTVLLTGIHSGRVTLALFLAAVPGLAGVYAGAARLRRVRRRTTLVLLQVGASRRTVIVMAALRIVAPAAIGTLVGVSGVVGTALVLGRVLSPESVHRRLLDVPTGAWLYAGIGCLLLLSALATASGSGSDGRSGAFGSKLGD